MGAPAMRYCDNIMLLVLLVVSQIASEYSNGMFD